MPVYQFQHFLSDPAIYAAAEQYWSALFADLLSHGAPQALWTPWFDTHFVDGTPKRDGNPIWSMVAREAHRGVRIIQDEPGAFTPEITAWLDTFGDHGDDAGITELVIVCILSDETESIVKKLLHAFVVHEVSRKDMEKLLAALTPQDVRL